MDNKLLIGIFLLLHSSLVAQKKIDIFDSVSVNFFLHNECIVKKIKFVQKNLYLFVRGKGYSSRILADISKISKTKIQIRVVNGNMKTSEKILKLDLYEQMEKIKRKIKPSSNTQCSENEYTITKAMVRTVANRGPLSM